MTLIIRNANKDFAEAVRSMAKACDSMIEITEQKEPSSEVNGKKMFYRLRSLKSIFEYKELEKQEIYFASLDELNDPMEGFRNIVFKGDKIVWRNLFRHYLKCLNFFILIDLMTLGNYDFSKVSMFPLWIFGEDFPTPIHKEKFNEIYQDFIQKYNSIIDKLSARTIAIDRDELMFYLDVIYSGALDTIGKHYKLPKNELEHFMWTMAIDMMADMIDDIEDILKDGEQGISFSSSLFTMMKNRKTANSLNNLSIKTEILNGDSVIHNFSNFYLQRLEKLMYPECYVACFMEEANNSSVWGHYGDGHRGICLVFETDDDGFLELCGRKYDGEEEYHKCNFQKVIYGDSYNETNFFETIGRMTMPKLISSWYTDEQGNKSPILDKILQDRKNIPNQYWNNTYKDLITKTKDWFYEKEYRIIRDSSLNDEINKENRKLKYHFKNLHGIIFGMRTSLQDKIKIINIIKQKCEKNNREDFKFYQAYYCQIKKKIEHFPLDISLHHEAMYE